jgi:acyl-CoA dehydrogenase
MIDFRLTDAEKKVIKLARDEAKIGHRYSRYYDKHEDELEPAVLPEVAGNRWPREIMAEIASQTSGPALSQWLVHLEESYGDIHLRRYLAALGRTVVNLHGTPEQKEKFGEKRLSISMTEPGAGSDVKALRSTATRDPKTGEWILNGEKMYCSDLSGAPGVLVLVRGKVEDGDRPYMGFVVEHGTPGFKLLGQVPKMGVRSWDTVNFVLENCRVPDFNRIDCDIIKTVMKIFNAARPNVGGLALGMVRALLEFTREKLGEQGVAVDYAQGMAGRSAIQDKLLRMEALYEASWLTAVRCKWLEDIEGGPSNTTMVPASVSKAMCGMAARRISQQCMELLGPLALSEEFLAEKWFRDCRIFDIVEGAGEINRLIIARSILGYSTGVLN